MSHTFFVKFRVFKREFLRNRSVYLAQIFKDNWNCYALSIFRGSISLTSSDNDEHMLMTQKMQQRFAYCLPTSRRKAASHSSFILYLTNRFYSAVLLFSNRSQMTSKCGKDKKVAHEPQANVPLHSYFIFTSSVICYWIDARQMESFRFIAELPRARRSPVAIVIGNLLPAFTNTWPIFHLNVAD